MSTSSSHQPVTDVQPARPRTTTGFSTFAGVVMVIAGILHILQGIAAIAHDHIYVSTPDYVYSFDLTGWAGSTWCWEWSSRPSASRSCADSLGPQQSG